MKSLTSGIELKIEFLNESNKKESIKCKIRDCEFDRIILDYPEDSLSLAKNLKEGSFIFVFISLGSGIRAFSSIVMTSPLDGPFEIEYPQDYEDIQRRKYIRAKWLSKATITDERGESYKVNIEDLGGAALKFTADNRIIREQSDIKIYLPLEPFLPSIIIEGKIKKKIHFKEYEYLLEYEKISKNDRDKIIKKCLELQTSEEWDK